MEFDRITKDNQEANSDNEWHKQLKEYLLGGAKMQGRPAVRKKRAWPTQPHKSSKQIKALRR